LSKTYFWQSDEYPKTRSQLLTVDRVGAKAIEKVWGVTTPPPLPQVEKRPTCSDDYNLNKIRGWRVCLDKKMTSADSMKQRTIAALDDDFKKIQKVLPPDAYAFLKKDVKVQVDYSEKTHGGVYHPSRKTIQLGVPKFVDWTKPGGQPALLLHELTHAWHYQKLGTDYKPITDAY